MAAVSSQQPAHQPSFYRMKCMFVHSVCRKERVLNKEKFMFTTTIYMSALCSVLNTIPTRIMAHYPFQDKLRVPLWSVYLLSALSMFLHFFLSCWCMANGYHSRIADLFTAANSLMIYYYCIRVEFSKLTFIYLLMTNYLMINRGIVVFITICLLSRTEANTAADTVILLALSVVTAPFIIMFLNIIKERALRSNAPQFWNAIWIIPAMTTLLVYLFTTNQNPSDLEGLVYLLARISLLLILMIMYYILICSLDSIQSQHEAENKTRQREQFIELQQLQYFHLTKQIEETRAARHDLRQHLNLINAYLEKGDNDALKDYIEKYGKRLPLNTWTVYSQNYTVDTIIRYYAEKAELAGIIFEYQLELPEKLAVEDPDICVLLGNLLENAIDDCCALTDQAAFIRIHARIAGEKAIAITVDNTCLKEPVMENDRFVSTKHSGPGTGTVSVRNIASMYNGLADFQYKDGIFYASVFLNPS